MNGIECRTKNPIRLFSLDELRIKHGVTELISCQCRILLKKEKSSFLSRSWSSFCEIFTISVIKIFLVVVSLVGSDFTIFYCRWGLGPSSADLMFVTGAVSGVDVGIISGVSLYLWKSCPCLCYAALRLLGKVQVMVQEVVPFLEFQIGGGV